MELTELQLAKLAEHHRRAERNWFSRLVRWLRWIAFSQDFCPRCERYTFWSTEMDNPIHPDGPPLFMRQHCTACGLDTGAMLTPPMAKALEKHADSSTRSSVGEK